jgi:PAS domain S-box-containing protein
MAVYTNQSARPIWSELAVRRRGVLIIAIPITCLIIPLVGFGLLQRSTLQTQAYIKQTQSVRFEANTLLAELTKAQSSIRAYGLTKRPEDLELYQESATKLLEITDKLDALVEDDPEQLERIRQIQRLTEQQLLILDKNLAQYRLITPGAAATVELNPSSRELSDTLRSQIEQFSTETRQQLDIRREILEYQQGITTLVLAASAVIGILGSLAALYLFDRLDQELARRAGYLRESHLRTQAVLDNVVDGILTLDRRGYIESANAAAERIFGYESAEFQSKHLQRLMAERITEDSGEAMSNLVGSDRHKLRRQQATLGRHKDGHIFPMEFAISEMRLDNERLFIAILRDITEREESEAALRKSEELYRTLAKNFPNGAVFLFDHNLRYTIAEGMGLTALGLESEAIAKKTLWETFPPETSAILEPTYRDALAGKTTVTEVPLGEQIYRLHVLPVKNERRKVFAGMMMTQDITSIKRNEEALRQRADERARMAAILAQTTSILENRNTELDQFAYIVSHDLKAPLRAIANLSGWIEEDIGAHLTEDTKHQMDLLRGRVHRMESMIDALLQYSRVGRLKTDTVPVDVEQLVTEIIDYLAPPPEFTVKVMPGMPTLMTERLPLEQVFSNLISNAVKHNDKPNGEIVIAATNLGDRYEFSVADNGPGIAPEYHEKVFVMFQTLVPRDRVENTGVGLAIVKKIVEDKRGTIYLESQLGQGTTFRFTWSADVKERSE